MPGPLCTLRLLDISTAGCQDPPLYPSTLSGLKLMTVQDYLLYPVDVHWSQTLDHLLSHFGVHTLLGSTPATSVYSWQLCMFMDPGQTLYQLFTQEGVNHIG